MRNASYEPLCHDWKARVTNDVISKSAGRIWIQAEQYTVKWKNKFMPLICAIFAMDVFNYNESGSDFWFRMPADLGCDYLMGVCWHVWQLFWLWNNLVPNWYSCLVILCQTQHSQLWCSSLEGSRNIDPLLPSERSQGVSMTYEFVQPSNHVSQ